MTAISKTWTGRRTPRLLACLSIVLACLGMIIAPTAEAKTITAKAGFIKYYWGLPYAGKGVGLSETSPWVIKEGDSTTTRTATVPTSNNLINDVPDSDSYGATGYWRVWPNSESWGGPAWRSEFSGHGDFIYAGYSISSDINNDSTRGGFKASVVTKSPDAGKILSPGKTFHLPVYSPAICDVPDNAINCQTAIATTFFPVYVRGIRFAGNGGTGTAEMDSPHMQNDDPNQDWLYTMRGNPYTRNGYTFVGWNTAANGSGTWYQPGDSVNMGKPQTIDQYIDSKATSLRLYAQWSQNPIRITYDGNGSTGGTTPEPHTVKPNVDVTIRKNTFTRAGYRFTGWNTAKDGSGTAIAPDSVKSFAKDTVLYAQWQSDPVLSYDTNKPSTWNGQMPATPASVSVPYNTTATDKSGWKSGDTSKLRGYRFLGWYTGTQDNAGLYDWSKPLTGNVTVHAHWQRLQANVRYDANGGTGSHANTTGWQYSDATIPSDASKSFKRDGYMFMGWNTKADKTGTAYKDGSQVPLQDKDVTLYAIWQPVHTTMVGTGGIGLPLLVTGGIGLLVAGVASTVMLARRMRGERWRD